MSLLDPVRNFYSRFERPISSLSLFAGFVFDVLTLKRVDTLWENLWITGYLLIIGVFIVLLHKKSSERGSEHDPSKARFWYVNILQFAFGGLFSAYLILYFRSADILVAWPFIALLAVTFIANEFLKRHYVRFSFQIGLFFLSVYSFAIFLVPVVIHRIGPWVFLLSGLISVLFLILFLRILFRFSRHSFKNSGRLIMLLVSGIFILMNTLYFTRLIPPIPLSLKDGGIYHSVQKINGNYEIEYENHGWRGYFQLYPEFHLVRGFPVYAFSAVFSPKNLDLTIVHEWQRYDAKEDKWNVERVISLPLVGGRDGGFRTFSVRENLAPGKWRVNVKTEQGFTIGQLRFNLVNVEERPRLSTTEK